MSSRDDFAAYTGQDSDQKSVRTPKKSNSSNSSNSSGSSNPSISSYSSSRSRDTSATVTLTRSDTSNEAIDLDELRKKLAHLKANSYEKIRKLSGKLKEDFDSLAQYVAWMYNTEAYPSLYEEIQKHFSGADTYQPGTIGAYCGGCLVKRKDGLGSRGCSVICAGSIPPPYEDSDWDFCEDLVIWAVYNGNSYEFTTLNEVEGEKDDKAIVFIEQDSMQSFPGFTAAEKKILTDNGITKIRLIYYNPKPNCETTYVEVSGGFIVLEQVKVRQSTAVTTSTTSSGFNWWWLVLLVIILLILFFFFYRCWC